MHLLGMHPAVPAMLRHSLVASSCECMHTLLTRTCVHACMHCMHSCQILISKQCMHACHALPHSPQMSFCNSQVVSMHVSSCSLMQARALICPYAVRLRAESRANASGNGESESTIHRLAGREADTAPHKVDDQSVPAAKSTCLRYGPLRSQRASEPVCQKVDVPVKSVCKIGMPSQRAKGSWPVKRLYGNEYDVRGCVYRHGRGSIARRRSY